MKFNKRTHGLKLALLITWGVVILGVFAWLHVHHIRVHTLPKVIRQAVLHAGPWGPLVVFCAYLISTLIPFPTAALALIAGSIYGRFFALILVILSLNAASAVSFYLGRFFGRHLLHEHERGLVKEYDDLMRRNGFLAVTIMRLVMLPHDVVSIASGMSVMRYRAFALGTLIGTLPAAVTFIVLGDEFFNPLAWLLFGSIFAVSVGLAFVIKRSPVSHKLQAHEEPRDGE